MNNNRKSAETFTAYLAAAAIGLGMWAFVIIPAARALFDWVIS